MKNISGIIHYAVVTFAIMLSVNAVPNLAMAEDTLPLSVGFINVDWMPFSFIQNNQFHGFAIEAMDGVFKQMRRDYHIERIPVTSALERLQTGDLQVFMGISKTHERSALYNYPEDPIFYDETVLIARTDNPFNFNGDVSNLIGKRVVIIDGAIHGPAFDNMYGIIRIPLDANQLTTGNFFESVLNGMDDFLVVNSRFGIEQLIKNIGIKDKLKIYDKPIALKSYYLAFSKFLPNSEKTAQRFNRVHRLFRSTGQYDHILEKYNLNSGQYKD